MRLHLADLAYLAPELTLVISAVLLAVLDLVLPSRWNRSWLGVIALLSTVVSAGFVIYYMIDINTGQAMSQDVIQLLNDSYRVDDFANLFKLLLLGGTALIIFMSLGSVKNQGIVHKGEYYYLFLPATLGAMIMTSSGDLITLFVGLELLSISSYVLVGMRKSHGLAGESAFKYFVNGSIATAFILYGMSFLYGMTGTTNIGEIRMELAYFDPSLSALMYLSFFLLITGLGVKIASAPFHAWAPDVYQGAATPVAAYLSTVSKAAGFAIIFRIVYNVYYTIGAGNAETPVFLDIFDAIMVIAALSMIVGNALALKQKNMKRLLAYSGIANAGYLLVPIGIQFGAYGLHLSNFTELLFYLIAYVIMNIGVFAVLMAVSRTAGHEEMSGFAGLYYRAPLTAVAMTVLILSLAGLPVTGGFFGKFYIMLGTVQVQQYWLAAIMIATSVASFYYYFSIIRQMYMRQDQAHSSLQMTVPVSITIWICAVLTVLLGLFPKWVIQYIERIYSLYSDFFLF